MALLRNRPVTVVTPIITVNDPVVTVRNADGTTENTPLRFIHMSETEHKKFAKDNPTLADHIKVIPDQEHQEILDSQNLSKIHAKTKTTAVAQPVQVKK